VLLSQGSRIENISAAFIKVQHLLNFIKMKFNINITNELSNDDHATILSRFLH